MLSPEDNDLLCRVEGDAPMGRVFRRHWIPACLIEEVPEPDGTPVHAKLLGEDLVIFRDTEGRVGVMDEHCPHRRASLAMGRNEEGGLRCLYHGWKVDVFGNVLEMASEPAASGLCSKVKHKAYPTKEWGGYVWTYMGPQEEMPEFEPPAFAPSAETRVSIVKVQVPCNWAQILEGAIDSAHSSSLHSTDMPPAPRLQLQQTPFGFRYAAIRRPIMNSATHDYIRITLFEAPYSVHIPPNNMYNLSILHIPQDDYNTYFYFVAWSDTGPGIDPEAWRKFCGAQPGVDLDSKYRKFRTRDNDYLQDRQAMKLGDFTGIRGIPMQDMAMWETMGRIADRSCERLGASDLAIVEFRRIMVEAVRAFAQGAKAIGTTEPRVPKAKLRSFEGIVPKSTDWKTLNVSTEELATQQQAHAAD
jgi:phthalate 4,5-dioxygenase oxygenase subunit